MKKPSFYAKLTNLLLETISMIPSSKVTAAADAQTQIEQLITNSSRRAGALSGLLSLPVGPLGMATLLPDIVAVWKIQSQLVADIAQIYGRADKLNRDTMLYCLFQHGQSGLQDIAIRVGQRYIVRRSSQKTFQGFLGKIGLRVSRILLGEGIARWVPFVGALAVARYSQTDTRKVGETARELFRYEIEVQSDEGLSK